MINNKKIDQSIQLLKKVFMLSIGVISCKSVKIFTYVNNDHNNKHFTIVKKYYFCLHFVILLLDFCKNFKS